MSHFDDKFPICNWGVLFLATDIDLSLAEHFYLYNGKGEERREG